MSAPALALVRSPKTHVHIPRFDGVRVTVITLVGEHDISTAPALRDALRQVPRGRSVVVDLGSCSFIDGSIIGLLLGASSRQRRQGDWFAIAHASREPLRALRILTRQDQLPVYDVAGRCDQAVVARTA